jgi:hypothetical protein
MWVKRPASPVSATPETSLHIRLTCVGENMKEELYLRIISNMRKGQRAVPLLKSISPRVHSKLLLKYGSRLNSERLYLYFHPLGKKKCVECGTRTPFTNFRLGFYDYCSHACANISGGSRQRRAEATMTKRYGVKNAGQSAELNEKRRGTMMERYGDTSPMRVPSIVAGYKRTLMEEYGVTNISQLSSTQETIRNNTFARHGVYSTNQLAEVAEKKRKNGYKARIVVHSGRTFTLQGYEPQALRVLLDKFKIPLWCFDNKELAIPYDKADGEHFYFPDFVVGNLIVEVKSLHTAGLNGYREAKRFRRNLVAKLKGAQADGKDFLLLVMGKKDNVVKCCFNSFKLQSTIDKIRSDVVCSAVSAYIPN